ncbi:HET-domain-containing protein [Cucurbitaria berberidis CBS 394.84]|uniref:HET-domain-containing protein n=1 Tax=Cucurbitaria berberidis CBS 394.84 TaxID=1168544 RepID=A0A9P4L3G7_9PLEO|nr:HET-domain-containing protein [Cucurbitaria berberidis CBS 394.84]KAF1840365.1 HET-domain-containing protein [Cucurbitaria berberidis CBS 394.84]
MQTTLSSPQGSRSSSSSAAYPFTFRCAPPGKESEDQGASNTLCYNCAQLDLEQSFANAFELYEGARRGMIERRLASCRKGNGPVYLKDFYFVTSLGSRLSQPRNCKLCNFLARMTIQPSKGTYKLLAFCSSESYLFEPRKKDVRARTVRRPWEATRYNTVEEHDMANSVEHNVFMAIVPEISGIPKTGVPVRWFETDLPRNGSIYRLTAPESDIHRLVLPRESGSRADFGLMRAWLTRCRCHHINCARRKPAGATLPGFRVIDCRKEPPEIVKRPWSERYVALSYVWGPPSGDWPQTILDAVEVTKRLGERYLWVDRTCIDQSNLEEKMFLISKMDAIYEGAEFTIVCAAGDARTGLPGVNTTPRRPQPWVELEQRSEKAKGKRAARFAPGSIGEIIGITEEEYELERVGETEWLDDLRFGMRGKMAFDFGELLADIKLKEKYDIPSNHLAWFKEMAEHDGHDRVEDYLDIQKELARRIGIPLKGIVPFFKRELAEKEGWDLDPSELDTMPISERPMKESSRPKRPLPSSKTEGKFTLVSSMQEPRTTVRNSEWATRGWTYQEGVLSNRRLVFTEEQVYWECRGMAVCETVDIALNVVHEPSGGRMANYMLSGIFDNDLHQPSELPYGFDPPKKEDIGDQVVALDGHIQAFTSRKLTNGDDSLAAFMGVAASYTTDAGLYLLLGLPVWAGAFANDKPGLQHTFALSISSWTHVADQIEPGAEMYVGDCPRRSQFPSWTWAGWQGSVAFCNQKQSKTHRMDETNKHVVVATLLPGPKSIGKDGHHDTAAVDPYHSDYFKALTSKEWVDGMQQIWSAEMMLHDTEGTYASLLTGWAPIRTIGDPSMTWLLTIHKPLVLRHLYLMHSAAQGEWRRLMGKIVSVHLSIPITEAQLVADHKTGHLVFVLVFASMIPFVYNGIARYLILRRADEADRWERIGRLNMWLTEKEMDTFRKPEDLIAALPVRPFGKDITIS